MDLPNKKNTAIIIISYNPDIEFKEVIARSKEIVDTIIVIDNNSSNKEELRKLCQDNNIIFLELGFNSGIGYAINQGIYELQKDSKLKWFITLDQDSLPPKSVLDYYNCVLKKESSIGVIGLRPNKPSEKIDSIDNLSYNQSLKIITSGTLHNLNLTKEIGMYDENLFIDGVDYDLVLRMNLNGYSSFIINNTGFIHKLGYPKYNRLLFLKKKTSNYPPIRYYYIYRNNLRLRNNYKKEFPKFFKGQYKYLIKTLIGIIFFENNKVLKLKNILKGIKDK